MSTQNEAAIQLDRLISQLGTVQEHLRTFLTRRNNLAYPLVAFYELDAILAELEQARAMITTQGRD